MATALPPPPLTDDGDVHGEYFNTDEDDGDTASQRSISLSSPHVSPRNSTLDNITPQPSSFAVASFSNPFSKRVSHATTLDTDLSSVIDTSSVYTHETGPHETPDTSAASSIYEGKDSRNDHLPTYPPAPLHRDSTASLSSFTSTSSRKARPESLILPERTGPLILGIALVDFNHLAGPFVKHKNHRLTVSNQVGPKIEYFNGDICEDEEVAKILPFLALPDGAHLVRRFSRLALDNKKSMYDVRVRRTTRTFISSLRDHSLRPFLAFRESDRLIYFLFVLTRCARCNQQIAASTLLVKDADVTRSIVQKAVVVLASKPLFGPIRSVELSFREYVYD